MPFVEINEMNMIHPHFMLIDFFRMSTDPLTSYWRIEKMMPRIYTLLKHYPLLKLNTPLPNSVKNWKPKTTQLHDVLNTVYVFLKNKKSLVTFGFHAYNTLLKNSGLIKKDNRYSLINVPYYEFISEEYVSDANALIDLLKNTYKEHNSEFKIIEHYPFFQFYGYNVKIYFGDTLICWAFDINKKCLPYQDLSAILVQNDSSEQAKNDTIRVGSFPLIIMMNLILTIYYRTNKDNVMTNVHQTLTSHFYSMRNFYLKDNKITFMDKSVFQELTVQCLGPKINPKREYWEEIDRKKKLKSGPYVYRYDPSISNTTTTTFKFANSSGNPINNPKNLRLVK